MHRAGLFEGQAAKTKGPCPPNSGFKGPAAPIPSPLPIHWAPLPSTAQKPRIGTILAPCQDCPGKPGHRWCPPPVPSGVEWGQSQETATPSTTCCWG